MTIPASVDTPATAERAGARPLPSCGNAHARGRAAARPPAAEEARAGQRDRPAPPRRAAAPDRAVLRGQRAGLPSPSPARSSPRRPAGDSGLLKVMLDDGMKPTISLWRCRSPSSATASAPAGFVSQYGLAWTATAARRRCGGDVPARPPRRQARLFTRNTRSTLSQHLHLRGPERRQPAVVIAAEPGRRLARFLLPARLSWSAQLAADGSSPFSCPPSPT